ncbi:hypothetical protein BC835DRAFT_853090 [Cytidiella melzeri]|nr:hypothetical protein BC835DRAFT_853090 [Cytidiella melzeri]
MRRGTVLFLHETLVAFASALASFETNCRHLLGVCFMFELLFALPPPPRSRARANAALCQSAAQRSHDSNLSYMGPPRSSSSSFLFLSHILRLSLNSSQDDVGSRWPDIRPWDITTATPCLSTASAEFLSCLVSTYAFYYSAYEAL